MGEWYTDTVLVLSVIFFILIVQFFRDPHRETPVGDDLIIAPADGKVVVIEEVDEPEYLKTKCRQISIFMSPVNVHVNRYPTSGKVLYEKYHPGKYLVAWHPKSSIENERTSPINGRVPMKPFTTHYCFFFRDPPRRPGDKALQHHLFKTRGACPGPFARHLPRRR